MSAREEILALVERHETVSTTAIRAAVSVRWSGIPPLLNLMIKAGEIIRVEQGTYAAASKAEWVKATATDGPEAQAILRALSTGSKSRAELALVTKGICGSTQAEAIVMRLTRQGMIIQNGAGYVLTAKGSARVPRAVVQVVMRPYVPPKAPPRRPGSMDFLRAPSIYPTQSAGVAA